jgi:outer membrane protein OmpA-like peptidoglycan-associated protein
MIMKQKFSILAAILISCTLVKAQDYNNEPQLGLKAGGNFSTLKAFRDIPTGLSYGWLAGPVGGAFGNIPVSNRLSFQIEALYNWMGAKWDGGTPNTDITQRFHYVSLPVMLKLHASSKFKVLLGGEWDVMTRAKETNNLTGVERKNKDRWRGDDFALTGGLEMWPARRWVLGARYIHGLMDLSGYNPGVKNRTVQVTLGHVLGKKAAAIAPAAVIPAIPVITDRDGDGVADADDKCPDVKGLAKYNGCPIPDSDGDGINDEEDKCPNVKGLAKYNGCPIPDSDGDGINDEEDKCPNVAGLARYNGCPIPDTDGDGINDEEDRCKTIPGVRENAGCPKIDFKAENIQFATGTANLTTLAKTELNKLVTILSRDYPNVRVGIEGHTDNVGKAESNQVLSEKRANAVKAYLVGKGIAATRLDAAGYGQTQPIADNATTEGRAKNRRVNFKVAE